MAKVTGSVALPEQDYRNYLANRKAGIVTAHDAAMRKLEETAASLPDGVIEGALLKFPAADGYAVYLVSKDTGRTVELKHVPHGDAWHAHPAMLRGLRRADIVAMVAADKRFAKLFASRRAG